MGAAHTPAATARGKIEDIQILRGIAIIFVLIQHFSISPGWFTLWIGVDLFFVISGFVVTYSVFKKPLDAGQFLLRRIFRLWPVMFALIALTMVVAMIAETMPGDVHAIQNFTEPFGDFVREELGLLFGYFIFTRPPHLHANGAMWSLSVEVQFYLAFAVAIWTLSKLPTPRETAHRALVAIAVLVYLAFFAGRMVALAGLWVPRRDPFGYLVSFRFDMMALGVIGTLMHTPAVLKRHGAALAPVLLCAPVIVLMFCESQHVAVKPHLHGIGVPFAGVCFLALVLIAREGAAFAWLPRWIGQALSWVGNRSYSIYVFHFALFDLFQMAVYRFAPWLYFRTNTVPLEILQVVVVSSVVLVIADLSYRYIEMPGQRIGRIFMSRLHDRTPDPARA